MRLAYLGHSSILIITSKGSKIIIDPYNLKVNRKFPKVESDIVLISHEHPDHNGALLVKGSPKILRRTSNFLSSFEIKTSKNEVIEFLAVPSFHDGFEGKKLGPNTIWVFTVDGIKVAHCGDLGHTLKENQIKEIGIVDVLIAPIGGGDYTIGPKEFLVVMEQLKSMISIPIHYKTSYTPWIKVSVDEIRYPGIQTFDDYVIYIQSLPELPKVFVFPEEVWQKIPEEINI
ncbi:MAG: MBL fold metallo-hydrolase [Candidatus Calescibacterium sp.]|nr:MBL fold metallo-hydrolase [Candidatus Calescibacterium sp.]MCX7972631.1 MBL fold metallo-hydrolase [bacterium]MDW8194772.1 MBL fold metallo-hydrolase [Candidatus Calescibacterium sp.]